MPRYQSDFRDRRAVRFGGTGAPSGGWSGGQFGGQRGRVPQDRRPGSKGGGCSVSVVPGWCVLSPLLPGGAGAQQQPMPGGSHVVLVRFGMCA